MTPQELSFPLPLSMWRFVGLPFTLLQEFILLVFNFNYDYEDSTATDINHVYKFLFKHPIISHMFVPTCLKSWDFGFMKKFVQPWIGLSLSFFRVTIENSKTTTHECAQDKPAIGSVLTMKSNDLISRTRIISWNEERITIHKATDIYS